MIFPVSLSHPNDLQKIEVSYIPLTLRAITLLAPVVLGLFFTNAAILFFFPILTLVVLDFKKSQDAFLDQGVQLIAKHQPYFQLVEMIAFQNKQLKAFMRRLKQANMKPQTIHLICKEVKGLIADRLANSQNIDSEYALHFNRISKSLLNHPKLFQKLREAQIPLSMKDYEGKTLLHHLLEQYANQKYLDKRNQVKQRIYSLISEAAKEKNSPILDVRYYKESPTHFCLRHKKMHEFALNFIKWGAKIPLNDEKFNDLLKLIEQKKAKGVLGAIIDRLAKLQPAPKTQP